MSAERPPRDSDLRIAVLPFVSRAAGGDTEALADGLTDDLTSGLARFPYLRVVSRPHAEAAKGRTADAQAAALVGARYLIEGTVRTAGPAVRITVRLVDVETGTHLWAETYDRSLASANVFDLQDDVTSRIVATAAASNGVLVRSMAGAVLDRPVEELTLDELVLRHFAFIQTFRADEHLLLRDGFERALTAQPRHAMAWACLANIYQFERTEQLNPLPDSEDGEDGDRSRARARPHVPERVAADRDSPPGRARSSRAPHGRRESRPVNPLTVGALRGHAARYRAIGNVARRSSGGRWI